MTLDELLALLPDNNTGAIDAADLRTIVTELWNQGAAVEARVAALEAAGGGSGVSVSGRWQINPQGGATPGGKQVTASTSGWSSATWLRFDPVDLDNVDHTGVLSSATTLFLQQQQDASNWARFDVTGPATDHGGYVEVPVTFVNGAGSLATAGWQDTVFVFEVPFP